MHRFKDEKTITLSDESIIQLFLTRDEKAIEEADAKYGRYLYTVAYNILGEDTTAQECKSDAYYKAWGAIPPERPGNLGGYLSQIIRRVAKDKYKEKSRQKRIPSEFTLSMDDLHSSMPDADTVEKQLDAKEIARVINEYLHTLTERDRYIFIGRFYMSDRLESIASQMGMSLSGVRRAIERMKKELKKELERNGVFI